MIWREAGVPAGNQLGQCKHPGWTSLMVEKWDCEAQERGGGGLERSCVKGVEFIGVGNGMDVTSEGGIRHDCQVYW